MKKINKKVLKVVERVIRNEIKRASGDPPFCLGIFHQPKSAVLGNEWLLYTIPRRRYSNLIEKINKEINGSIFLHRLLKSYNFKLLRYFVVHIIIHPPGEENIW